MCHTCSAAVWEPVGYAHQTVPPSPVSPCTWWLQRKAEWEKPAPATTMTSRLSELYSDGSGKNEHNPGVF